MNLFTKPRCFTKNILTVLVTTVISVSVSIVPANTARPCHFPAIFNFGDSNSDTGGLSSMFGQVPAPCGESYFHTPAGRYCDGRLVIDFIAERLGLPYVSAYLDAIGSNFTSGANFATAGSTIRRQNTTFFQTGYSPISLDVQFSEFYDFHHRSQTAREKDGYFAKILPKEEDFSRALYMFDIGQNDLTSGYFLNMTTSEVEAYIPELVSQFKTTIERVYGEGGRYFWIHNTGPLGCLPYILQRLPVPPTLKDKAGCATPFNDIAQLYNRRLKEIVDQLRKELPLAAITYVDVYSAKYSIISQPKKYGFKQQVRACCGHGENEYNYNVRFGCGSKIQGADGKEILVGKACENPRVWINWDGYHYTEAANRFVFDQIVDGSLSAPPIPLRFACHTS